MKTDATPLAHPPTVPDRRGFSSAAIQKAVIGRCLNHPLTLFPATFGLLGVFWMGLMEPTLAVLLASIASFSTGIGSLIINYCFRWDSHANGHLEKMARAMANYRKWSKSEIKRVLMECEKMGGVGRYAAKGRQQYDDINGKFDLLRELLAKKLDPQEVAYARFLGSAEQVYLNTLDNLRDLVNYIKSIASIGREYTTDLTRLSEIEHPSPAEQKELATLMERDELKKNQQRKIDELLALNEQALTKIDVTIAAFTGTRIRRRQADVDIETAIKELENLAAQVQKYAAP